MSARAHLGVARGRGAGVRALLVGVAAIARLLVRLLARGALLLLLAAVGALGGRAQGEGAGPVEGRRVCRCSRRPASAGFRCPPARAQGWGGGSATRTTPQARDDALRAPHGSLHGRKPAARFLSPLPPPPPPPLPLT